MNKGTKLSTLKQKGKVFNHIHKGGRKEIIIRLVINIR